MFFRLFLIVSALSIFNMACHCCPAGEVFLPGASQDAVENEDAVFKSCVAGADATSEFRTWFQNPSDGALSRSNIPNELKNCDILIVHGFLGDVGISATRIFNSFSHNQHFVDYLKDQQKTFKALGLKYRVADFKSRSVSKSGEKIAKIIRDNSRPVIVFSHSKGSLDTLDALLRLQREGQLNKVAGWISVQGPFYGTPDAEHFLAHWYLRLGARIGLTILGDDMDAIRDMTVSKREVYMANRLDEIKQVTQTIPTICFASWAPPKDKDNVITMEGELNDGNVPTRSAILPGSVYVAKANVSHKVTVMHTEQPFNRVAFTKALLSMLSTRIVPETQSASSSGEVATH